MRHLKTFLLFEDEISSKFKSDIEKLLDEVVDEVSFIVETNRREMNEWVVEEGLQRVADKYLNSDEFREFTIKKIKESKEYKDLDEWTDLDSWASSAVEDQTYWGDFLEETGYDSVEIDKVSSEIKFLPPKGKNYAVVDVKSKWYKNYSNKLYPIFSIDGRATITREIFSGSFLPFGISSVNLFEEDELDDLVPINKEFQTSYSEDMVGELVISNTNLIALDKGPEWAHSIYISGNSRLISLEGIGTTNSSLEIDEDNGLSPEILKSSILLMPGTPDSIKYYQSLLNEPAFVGFDEEQILFVLDRIGHNGGIQKYVDENPEKMAVLLKSVWKKIKSIDKFKDLQFPENLKGEVDLLSDLHDVGL